MLERWTPINNQKVEKENFLWDVASNFTAWTIAASLEENSKLPLVFSSSKCCLRASVVQFRLEIKPQEPLSGCAHTYGCRYDFSPWHWLYRLKKPCGQVGTQRPSCRLDEEGHEVQFSADGPVQRRQEGWHSEKRQRIRIYLPQTVCRMKKDPAQCAVLGCFKIPLWLF